VSLKNTHKKNKKMNRIHNSGVPRPHHSGGWLVGWLVFQLGLSKSILIRVSKANQKSFEAHPQLSCMCQGNLITWLVHWLVGWLSNLVCQSCQSLISKINEKQSEPHPQLWCAKASSLWWLVAGWLVGGWVGGWVGYPTWFVKVSFDVSMWQSLKASSGLKRIHNSDMPKSSRHFQTFKLGGWLVTLTRQHNRRRCATCLAALAA
jgi:hypothetical protein